MADALEQAVLSGALFDGSLQVDPELGREPIRSRSPSPEPNTDDELGSDLDPSDLPTSSSLAPGPRTGPQTGVKGVIRDRELHDSAVRTAAARSVDEAAARLRGMALSARTYADDMEAEKRELEERLAWEREDEDERRAREAYRRARMRELRREPDSGRRVFGHLREVDENMFISALEDEDEDVVVVVLLHEPSIPNSLTLTTHLSTLAPLHPHTKFLRASARSLAFGIDKRTGQPDPDILPTLLIYRAGELMETLVRPDRGGAKGVEGIEALLLSHGALERTSQQAALVGDLSDEGDDD